MVYVHQDILIVHRSVPYHSYLGSRMVSFLSSPEPKLQLLNIKYHLSRTVRHGVPSCPPPPFRIDHDL